MEFAVRRSSMAPRANLGLNEPSSRQGTAVGWSRARAHLHQVIRDARAGRSGVSAVHGLTGSGKTFLLEDAAAEAPDFLRVTLPIAPGAPGPWQALFELDALDPLSGDRLRQAAVEAIRATAGSSQPVLIVFDDCRPIQTPVAQAVAAAVLDPELGVTAVLALAWSEDVDGSASPLQFDLPAHRLEPFTEEEAAHLIRTRTGSLPDPGVLRELWIATGGNPAGMLSAGARLSDDELDGMLPLPSPLPIGLELAEGFGDWVDLLEPDARLAVTVASTIEMSRTILEEALAQLDLTLDALRPAKVLGIVMIGAERVTFIHPLCRAAAFQMATHDSQRLARQAVSEAFLGAGMPEQAAVLATTSASSRDEGLTALCLLASRAAMERNDHGGAAQFLTLASQFSTSDEESAHHLLDASTCWQSGGRADRARLCRQRVAPVNVSPVVMGHTTYHGARSAFMNQASPTSPAQMALGAEVCIELEPEAASIMLADAAASALILDLYDEALTYAQRAVHVAAEWPAAREWASFTRDAITTLISGPGTLEKNAMQDAMVGLTATPSLFPGSPQLAYVLGSALVHVSSPALMGRWLTWMESAVSSDANRSMIAVIALVRSRSRMGAGDVEGSAHAASDAVLRLDDVQDLPLLARALSWTAWVNACSGDVARSFEAASRFFALDQSILHYSHVQVLTALAHSEVQRGRLHGAHAWLRALEEDSDYRAGHRGCYDWPSLSLFLQLALLAGFEHEALAACEVPGATDQVPEFAPLTEGLRDSERATPLDGGHPVAPTSSPLLNAHQKLTSALRQRQLGMTDLATFNFSRAEIEFAECGAHGWSRLAVAQLSRLEPMFESPVALQGDVGAAATSESTELAAQAPEPETGDIERSDQPSPFASAKVRLLGDFSVFYDGEPAVIPLGHAAQALKIIALFRRISVDELAELLWPGAEPGVGARRLRNILWRIKSASGDVVRRSDNLICLEDSVVTDVGAFEDAAALAFEEGLTADEAAARAREAVAQYGGELLPSDRYADWTAGPREALTQKRLQLLDLLLTQASQTGNRLDALALLEELISADPYEERYYLQLASLHLEAGNRSRMRAAVSRGERMLADLGVQPSQSFVDFVSGTRD